MMEYFYIQSYEFISILSNYDYNFSITNHHFGLNSISRYDDVVYWNEILNISFSQAPHID